MINRNWIKKTSLTVSIVLVLAMLTGILYSCAPALTFGDLTICSGVDSETGKPLDAEDSFTIETDKIYATIEISGVKADESRRFSLVNKDTGEVISDDTDIYSTKLEGYIEGFSFIEFEDFEDDNIFLEPGRYEINYYHKGELIDSADFEILSPEAEIIEVSLADMIDENTYAPVSVPEQFTQDDIVYTVLEINYAIAGDMFEARWFRDDEMINQKSIPIEENDYSGGYIAFTLSSETGWEAGQYSVELYHNNDFEGKYNFVVEAPPAEEAGAAGPFSQGLVYISEKYNFGFALPDDWQITESEDESGLTLEINYLPEEIPLAFSFIVSPPGGSIPRDRYREGAEEIVSGITADGVWELSDEAEGELINSNNITYYEYDFYYSDPDGNDWAILINYFEGSDDRAYIMFTMSLSNYYDMATPLFDGIINSFSYLN